MTSATHAAAMPAAIDRFSTEAPSSFRPSPLWWLPYAVGGFMLTPFAIWAGLYAFGMDGPKSGFGTPEMVALLLASLPLAAFFFLANLGQMASAMQAGPQGERMPRAARIMPWLSGFAGIAGIVALVLLERGTGGMAALAAATLAMVSLMTISLRRDGRAAEAAPPKPVSEAEEERAVFIVATPLLAVVFIALAWSPAVIFYAALVGVPLAFAAILRTAHADGPEAGS
ncbi:MAG: hypothetical protein MUC89_01730 [Acetobacteraceae bacterium]|jgi:hypothetical protein|nr:hypothetical protein [Acetobacteraceae bacterium]